MSLGTHLKAIYNTGIVKPLILCIPIFSFGMHFYYNIDPTKMPMDTVLDKILTFMLSMLMGVLFTCMAFAFLGALAIIFYLPVAGMWRSYKRELDTLKHKESIKAIASEKPTKDILKEIELEHIRIKQELK